MKTFEMAVVEACGLKNLKDVESLSQRELVDKIILPLLFRQGGSQVRYSRISGRAMQFLADWGEECLQRDRFTGELLLELGLQRISVGAMRHEGVNLETILTENPGYAPYRRYAACWDEPGLMGQECWNFIVEQMGNCLTMENEKFRAHAEKVLFGILTHLTSDGKEGHKDGSTVDLLWNEDIVEESPRECWLWALEEAQKNFELQTIAKALVPTWSSHMYFFKKYGDQLDWEGLWKEFDLSERANLRYYKNITYFSSGKRLSLKLFGRYDKAVEKKSKEIIRAEIARYDLEKMTPVSG